MHASKAHYFSERRRKEAVQASSNLTHALVDHLNVGYVYNVEWLRILITTGFPKP